MVDQVGKQSNPGEIASLSEEGASSVLSRVANFAKEHPILSGAIAVAATAATAVVIGSCVQSHLTERREAEEREEFSAALDDLVATCQGIANERVRLYRIREMLVRFDWEMLGIPAPFINERNLSALAKKLQEIIKPNREDQPKVDVKQRIVQNVLRNFIVLASNALEGFRTDLREEEFRALFGLAKSTIVESVELLGEETHSAGRVPLCFTLHSGDREVKIVWKPRSLESARAVCGGPDSLFGHLELPTYRIYSVDGSDHGYCEFLYHRKSENIFNSEEEIIALLMEYRKIHEIAYVIGMGDLHYENLAVIRKRVFAIDVEVIGLPTEPPFDTEVLSDDGEGGGALSSRPNSMNRIWLHRSLYERACMNYNEGITQQELRHLLRDYGLIRSVRACFPVEFQEAVHGIINMELNSLLPDEFHRVDLDRLGVAQKNRIVLIPTKTLSRYLLESPELARTHFLKQLQDGLEKWHFQPISEVMTEVSRQFDRDYLNNDVPIFHYDRTTGIAYYGRCVIGIHRSKIDIVEPVSRASSSSSSAAASSSSSSMARTPKGGE